MITLSYCETFSNLNILLWGWFLKKKSKKPIFQRLSIKRNLGTKTRHGKQTYTAKNINNERDTYKNANKNELKVRKQYKNNRSMCYTN